MDTATIFELASVSKAFTAMVIMQLHDQKKLALDDSLRHYIPNLPYRGITLRHLLNHTSGLPDYQTVMDTHWDKSKVADNNDNIEYLIRFAPPAHFGPGERYEYSNTGYMLLASVAERASGRDFLDLCRSGIFKPLGMVNTDIRTRDEKIQLSNMAWGHIYDSIKGRYVQADSFPVSNYTIWLGNRKGPGRISSTARDLLAWDQALYTTKLVAPATLREAFASATLTDRTTSNYGFGWELATDPALGKVVQHSGDNPGYKTYLIRYIDKNLTVIVLCNSAIKTFDEVIIEIRELMKKEFA
jgi:CubicO group peptidase (beta-lactamase class C family)